MCSLQAQTCDRIKDICRGLRTAPDWHPSCDRGFYFIEPSQLLLNSESGTLFSSLCVVPE